MNMEKTVPKLSIIVPVHNVEKQLPKCIDSILGQVYTDFECIIVNDASTDRSEEVAKQFAEKDSRVRVINQEWGGVSKARNNGIKAARGKYVGFIDGDDYIEPSMYAELIEMMEKHQSDIVCCNIDYRGEDGTIRIHSSGNVDENMSGEVFMEHIFDRPKSVMGYSVNKVYLKEKITAYFDETHRICEDMEFVLKYCMNIKTASYIDEAFYHVFERSSSASRSNPRGPFEGLKVRESFVDLMAQVNRHLRDIAEADYLDSCLLYDKSNEAIKRYVKKNWMGILRNRECSFKLKIKYLQMTVR